MKLWMESDLPQLIDFEATRAVDCEIFKEDFELWRVADFYARDGKNFDILKSFGKIRKNSQKFKKI